jgi:hypothetical protein
VLLKPHGARYLRQDEVAVPLAADRRAPQTARAATPPPPDMYSSAAMLKAFVLTVKKIKRLQGHWNYLDNNAVVRRTYGFIGGLPHPRFFIR